jgi:hypothetical protein
MRSVPYKPYNGGCVKASRGVDGTAVAGAGDQAGSSSGESAGGALVAVREA